MSVCEKVPAVRDEQDSSYVNIAAYLFTTLDKLPERRETLRSGCKKLGLKGTILLSPEGINLFMAGRREAIDQFLEGLRRDPLLAGLEVKESLSDHQPFRRLLVKLKKEIIAFGVEGIDPRSAPSRKLPPVELKKWLDEGRPVTLLDTRNDYEVALGTFTQARPIGIDHFRDFPAAVAALPEELKQQPIVMFCTGGIRCEKAGPYMEQVGFREIYQLEGGILKYFEECGGDHYQGECFVFDQRVALDPGLAETQTTQCFACQHPLTVADQQNQRYVRGKSCPYCWKGQPPEPPVPFADREAAIAAVTNPLPGAGPYESVRPLNVPARYDGWQLIDFLCEYLPHVSRAEWHSLIEQKRLRERERPLSADLVVRAGQRLCRIDPETTEPAVDASIRVLAWEDDYVVFNKPAPLPLHPCGRFNRNSMTEILQRAFPGEYLSPVHRLDANTTGLVVFARSREAVRGLQRQFACGGATKAYRCRVLGQPDWNDVVSTQPISRKPAENGFRVVDPGGDEARTSFRVLTRCGNGETLVEAVPRTGRTNQIRVHLWDLGHPIVGDPVYLPQRQLGERQTISMTDPPMCLHASKLAFQRPHDGAVVRYEAPWPKWGQSSE